MERATTHCGQCHQLIIAGERFVCFKIPGKETYQFFHCRFRVRDCWEEHVTSASKALGTRESFARDQAASLGANWRRR